MFRTIRKWWPAAVCLFIYYAVLVWFFFSSTQNTGGRLIYPLDDTYIHMAMAKNFSSHGVWGFTRYAFSSATSSPLYTGLLAAAYFILGRNDILPFFLNVLFGTVLIVYLYRLFRREASPFMVFTLLLAVVFTTSVPALTMVGMEHLLHALLTLAFVCLGADTLSKNSKTRPTDRLLLLIGALLPVTRYEGIFAVAVLSLFLFLRKRYRLSITLAAVGALPVLLYGAVSVRHGWLLVPNSIWLKGERNWPAFSSLQVALDSIGRRSINQATQNPIMLIILVMTVITCFRIYKTSRHVFTSRAWWRAVLFMCILFLHLQTSRIGWLYRYEAYLVATGLTVTLPALAAMVPSLLPGFLPARLHRFPLAVPVFGLLVLTAPLCQRGQKAFMETKMAMYDRYFEHIQPARFLNDCYPGATVIVNDIGAAAYYTDCRLLDMYGLGNMEPVRFRWGETGYTKKKLDEWANKEGAEIAILQVEWTLVSSKIPDSWVKVAEWKTPRNVIFNDTRIGFYAVRRDAADSLANRILAYRSKLPEQMAVQMDVRCPATDP